MGTSSAAVAAELRRVVDDLAEAEEAVDAAARQVNGLLYLRLELANVRQLLGRVGEIVDRARDAERGAPLTLPRTNAWLLGLPFAIAVVLVLSGQVWWQNLLVFASAYGLFVAAGYAFAGTVLRSRARRTALRRTSLTGLVPVDVDTDVSADELTPPVAVYRDCQALLRSRTDDDVPCRAVVRLGKAAVTVVGAPGAPAVPHFPSSAALPALKRLVVDLDELTGELARRPLRRRDAGDGVEHYRRARGALVHAYQQLCDTATKILAEGRRVGAASQRNSSRASHSMARSSSRTW